MPTKRSPETALPEANTSGDANLNDALPSTQVPLDEEGPPLDVILGSAFRASPEAVSIPPARDDLEHEREEADRPSGAVPLLDDLVARIPADVRERLVELFRARFVKVARIPKHATIQPLSISKTKAGTIAS